MNNSDFFGDDNDEEFFNAYEDSAADLKFRSIRVDSHPTVDHFASYHHQNAGFGVQTSVQYLKTDTSKSSSEAHASGCPSAPFGLSKNNFNIINHDFATVQRNISNNLSGHENFDFSYMEGEFMWKGKYLCGSSCFELEVNLYHDKAVNTYTVAVRKVSCDSAVNGCFGTFFAAMKAALCNDTTSAPAAPARKPFCIPKGCSYGVKVSDAEFLQGVQSIFAMAGAGMEARVQCVKMLCDLAQKDAHYLELAAFRPQCVQLLEELVADESDDVRQHAVMAVAAFAELGSYKEAFLASSVLPALFCLVENCQYETAQMRRTAAAVLALLCRTHPYTVRAELAQQDAFCVADWMQRVSCLEDARTRESALVVKSFLEDVSVPEMAHRVPTIEEEEEAALMALIH